MTRRRPGEGEDQEGGRLWTRRAFLGGLGGVLAAGVACRPSARAGLARFDGFPIARLDGLLTPTSAFFVRDHFGIPQEATQAAGDWSVSIEGDVRRPLRLRIGDLGAPGGPLGIEQPVTLECAGNAGRNGVGWQGARAFGGVSTGRFQGVSLADLLRRADPLPSVREIVFEGADCGAERGSEDSHCFARSVPLADALGPTGMLATGLNGAPLPARHGGPLRVVLPGRYATDSVKWVKRIRAVSSPFEGFYQSRRYRRAVPGDPVGLALGTLRVQSEIARPGPGARLPSGLMVNVTGVAWGGKGGIARVQVSVDGGATFSDADLIDPDRPDCWRRWVWRWQPDRPGPRLLISRATDRSGAAQPFASGEELGLSYSLSGPDRIQYANNAVPMIPVEVV